MTEENTESRSRYGPAEHKKFYTLWAEGETFKDLAARPDAPSIGTLHNWSREDYDCECSFHGWKSRKGNEIQEAMDELPEYSEESIKEREKQRLQFLSRVEEQLNQLVEEGDLNPPKSLDGAIGLLERVYSMQRLLQDQPTSISKIEDGIKSQTLDLTKVTNQIGVDKRKLIEAMEDGIDEQG